MKLEIVIGLLVLLFVIVSLKTNYGPKDIAIILCAIILELLMIPCNKYFALASLIGNEPFYEDTVLETSSFLTKNYEIFKEEALSTCKSYSTITNDIYFMDLVDNKDEWTKLYIKWHSDIDPIARKKCPKTCELIESRPDIKIAMFSVLKPGARIKPHYGPYKGCLRYHLGVSTPNSDDCFISVDDKKYSWRDGKGILLDDTYTHWVENNTNEKRIILFCDIVRPMGPLATLMNEPIMKIGGKLTTRGN